MPLTVGGGVRTLEDIRALLLAGADKVSINTAAVHDRDFVREAAEKFGSQCIVVAIDAKQTAPGKWEIFTHGGRNADRPRRGRLGARKWSRSAPAKSCSPRWTATAPERASTFALTRAVAEAVGVPVIASGGVGTLDHLVEGIRDGGATAVLAASIFHFGEFTIAEAKRYMAKSGLRMRLDGIG